MVIPRAAAVIEYISSIVHFGMAAIVSGWVGEGVGVVVSETSAGIVVLPGGVVVGGGSNLASSQTY